MTTTFFSTYPLSFFMKTKKLLPLLLFLLFFGTFHADAAPLGLSINPVMVEKMLSPSDTASDQATITNPGSTPIVVYTSLKDFTSKDTSGAASYVVENDKEKKDNLSSWINIQPTIQLLANETKKVPFTITVPKDATPGGHYATIFFQPRPEKKAGVTDTNAQVQTNALIGMHVLVTVGGDIVKKVELASFQLPEQKGMSDEGVIFETVFKNGGNVHLTPKGRIEIYDSKGVKIPNIGLLQQKDANGNIYSESTVDFIPLNQKSSKVLPNQTRIITDEWKFSKNFEANEEYTAKLVWENPQTNKEENASPLPLHFLKQIAVNHLQADKQFVQQLPVSFTAEIENKGTLQLHPHIALQIRSPFGGIVSTQAISFEGTVDVDQKKPIQALWDRGDIPFLGAYADIIVSDSFGKELGRETIFLCTVTLWQGIAIALLLLVVLVGVLRSVKVFFSPLTKKTVKPRKKIQR